LEHRIGQTPASVEQTAVVTKVWAKNRSLEVLSLSVRRGYPLLMAGIVALTGRYGDQNAEEQIELQRSTGQH
jgi:hypothetical protein